MTKENNFLGKRIQELRKSKNLTQADLAALINVVPKYISRLETGTSNPSIETVANIAEKLECEIAELFNYSHFKKECSLIDEITTKLKNTSEKNVKLIYQITNDIINSN